MHNDQSLETSLASQWARLVSTTMFAVVCLVFGLNIASTLLPVPAFSSGVFRQKVEVPLERRNFAELAHAQIIEHTVEKSDFKVDRKLPEKEPEPQKEPEKKQDSVKKIKPVQTPKTKIRPKYKNEMVIKPQPTHAEKQKVEEKKSQLETQGSDQAGDAGGIGQSVGQNHSSDSQQNSLKESALALIVNVIEANKHYPRRARQTGIEGKVILSVAIANDGVIHSVNIKEKHNSSLLNRAAMKAAEKLLGMRLGGMGEMRIEVPIVFKLQ